MHDRRSYVATSFTVGFFLLLFFNFAPAAHGQERQPKVVGKSLSPQQIDEDWKDCGLRKLEQDAHVSHRPDPTRKQEASSDIQVTYGEGFTSESRAAFERAVEIWETHISSPIPIEIDASFEDLDSNVLGGAGPVLIGVDTTQNDEADIIMGTPLFKSLTGQDPLEDNQNFNADISASFNRDRNDWHFGEDPAPSGRIDFTSVVLHEIGHGLNYIDLFRYNNGEGEYGLDFNNNDQLDSDERMPGFYGEHVVEEKPDGLFFHLTNEAEYPNPSQILGDALTSDRLFFRGQYSNLAAEESEGPVPPKLYAPEDFDEGSSISHLDEDTYPFETINSLMTPRIASAETVRLPGPIACGQLRDMGWDIGPGCAFEDIAIEGVTVEQEQTTTTNRGEVELNWSLEGGGSLVDEFIVEHQYYDQSFQERKRVPAEGQGEYSTTIEDLQPGQHTFRLKYVFQGGGAVQSGEPVDAFIEAQQVEISVYPNPFTAVANVSFVLPERQEVRVEVYDALGRRVALPFEGERPADDARPVRFDARQLQDLRNGMYFFRVIGEDFAETVKAVRLR